MPILPYTDALAPYFHAINAAWISDMFVLEPHDEHVLSHPRETIVDKGGVILFAEHPEHGPDRAIVGTGALMPTGPGAYELTKMGVLASARGTGIGAELLDALIAQARALPGIETLYLLTSSKCAAAIHLYEKAGFVHDEDIMARYGATYARCNVAMRYPLWAQATYQAPARYRRMPYQPLAAPQTAGVRPRAGNRFAVETTVSVTPLGLLAVGGLVAAVLLSVPPIIRAAKVRPADRA